MRIIHIHFNVVIVCDDNLRLRQSLRLITTAKKQRNANFSEAEVNVSGAVAASHSTLYGKFFPNLTNSMRTSALDDVAKKYEIMSELIGVVSIRKLPEEMECSSLYLFSLRYSNDLDLK